MALSRREADVARCVVAGLSYPEIAVELGITEKTAQDYVWRLCQGLWLRSRRELATWCVQNPRAIGASRSPAAAGLHPKGCDCGAVPCEARQNLLAA